MSQVSHWISAPSRPKLFRTGAAGMLPQLSLLIGASLLGMAPAYAQDASGVCRVAENAAATNDGASWTNAMGLEAALAAPGCTQIWMKEGLYKQTTTPKGFVIARNLKLYGGFKGNETSFAERASPADRSLTKLDGDAVRAVLYIDGASAGGISSDTVIDGLTIQNGLATQVAAYSGAYEISGGGIYCYGSGTGHFCNPVINNVLFINNIAEHRGGALYAEGDGGEASPTISNSRFEGNQAYAGGAVYNNGTSGGVSSPTIKSSTFINNAAEPQSTSGQGGAIFNWGGGGVSSPMIDSCTFSGNTATADAGAIMNWGMAGVSSPNIVNSTFSQNIAAGQGGAILNFGVFRGNSSPTILNSTFSGNSANSGGAINNSGLLGNSTPSISGSILWGNTLTGSGPSGAQIYNSSANPTVKNSIVEGVLPNSDGNLGTDPLLGALADNAGLTQTMLPGPGSSALDLYICEANSPSTDQRGVSRPQETKCDAGAVERVVTAQTLTVSVQGSNLGSVTDSSGLISACMESSGICSGNYSDNTTAFTTLSASAPAGSTFNRWTGDACDGSTALTCEVIVDKSKSVTAIFDAFTVAPTAPAAVIYGTAFSQVMTASGGAGPYTYIASQRSSPDLTFDTQTATLSAPATLPAGTYTIRVRAVDSNNASTLDTTVTVQIAPAPLTITADDKTITYGQPLPTFTASYSGWVNGDTVASLTTEPTIATDATGASPAGTYAITPSGAVGSNYSISYVPGTLTIDSTSSSVTLTPSSTTVAWGQSVTLTANVPLAPGSSGGTMTFMSGMSPVEANCTVVPVTVSPAGVGTAQCVTSNINMGKNHLRVSFNPADVSFKPSTSTDVIITGVQINSQVTIGSTPNPSMPGQEVTFTLSVGADPTKSTRTMAKAAAVAPTGTVTLSDGSVTLGTATLDATGTATLSVQTLTLGTHHLLASYSGDAIHSAVTQSAAHVHRVNAAPVTTPVPLFGEWWEKALMSLMVLGWMALGLRGRKTRGV